MLVGLHVQGDHFRGKPGSEFNALARDIAPAIDGDNRNGMHAEASRVNGDLAGGEHLHEVVVAADNGKENNYQRNEKQRDPSALHEFRYQYDSRGTGSEIHGWRLD